MRSTKVTVGSAAAKIETGLLSLASVQAQYQRSLPNSYIRVEPSATLPNPKTRFAESIRQRQQRNRSSSSWGRTRSRSI